MRFAIAAATLALVLAAPALAAPALAAPAIAQMPAELAATGAPCAARQANLGGVGRASVVAFTGAIFGDRVCATVANVALDSVAASLAAAPAADALVVAPLGDGRGAGLSIAGDALAIVPADAALRDPAAAPVGPFVIAPGGRIADFAGDTKAEPRVVLAYAGQRLLVIGTSPVTLADLARALRDQPDLFGADAVERAVVLATGPGAALVLRSADGDFGTPAATPATRYLSLAKRG